MLSPIRAFAFALHLAVFTLLVLVGSSSLGAVPALAAPVPAPSPMIHDADFAPRLPQNATTPVVRDLLSSIEDLGSLGSTIPRDLKTRDITTILGDMNVLNNYYTGMQTHASNFRTFPCVVFGLRFSPSNPNFQVRWSINLPRAVQRTIKNKVLPR